MRAAATFAALCAALVALPVMANAPATSPQPLPRPSVAAAVAAAMALPKPVVLSASALAVPVSIRPIDRPENLKRRSIVRAAAAIQTQPAPVIVQGKKGSVCGVNGIKGERLAPIPGRIKGCGVAKPVRVTSVDGVALSSAAIMDCPTAKALNSWVRNSAKPAVGRLGGGVTGLKVAAGYACRPRNNKQGARISEHGRGRAIDISGIILRNGAMISVLKGWKDRAQGKLLKAMHRGACGPFGTVLGPNANALHRDHFHFDTARYRGGPYCR